MAVDFTPNEYLKNDEWGTVLSGYPFSMSCLFNKDTFVNGSLIALADSTQLSSFHVLYLLSDQKAYAYSVTTGAGGTNTFAIASSNYTTNTWGHVGATYNSNSEKHVYLNGGNKGSKFGGNAVYANIDRISIGAVGRAGPINFLDGSVAEVGVWNVVLTDMEMYTLGLGVSPLLVRPQNLIFYAPLVREPYNDLVGGLQFSKIGTPVVAEHPRVLYPSGPQNTFYSFPAPPPISTIQSELRKFQIDNEVRQFKVDNEVRKFRLDNEVRQFNVD